MDPFTVQQLVEEPTLNPCKALVVYSGTTQELKPMPHSDTTLGPRLRRPHPIKDPKPPPPLEGMEQTVISGNLRGTHSDSYDFGTCLPYLGNYCGPYYSAGQLQSSVQSDVPPCSDSDQVCLEHDACYASGRHHSECDHDFVTNDDADSLMSALIGVQISARNLYSYWSNNTLSENMTNKRGKLAAKQDKNKNKNAKSQQQRNMQVVQAPTAMTVRQSNIANKPQYKTSKTGVVISHSELITGLFVGAGAPTAYNAVKLVINPGKFSTFPWLATIATNYDKYVFRKLRFIYMPLVATSVSGRAGLAYDYDSSDAVPGNRADFFSMTKHSEAAIWAPISLDVPLDNVERFTNTHTLTDSKLIDVGSIIYMSDASSATAGSVVGDVLCEYEVELRRPQSSAYVTQSLSFTTGYATGLDLSPYIKGPAIATITAYGSTSIVISALSPGRYLFFASVNDAGAGTPTLTISYTAATLVGNARTITSTTDSNIAVVFDVSAGAGSIQLACAINLSACEKTMLTISKVDSGVPGFL